MPKRRPTLLCSSPAAFCVAAITACAVAIWASKAGSAQSKTFDGFYEGSLECEQLTGGDGASSRDPLSIMVRDETVMALYESAKAGSGSPEVPAGRIEPHGVFRLGITSYWTYHSMHSDYSGTLNGSGGTLTGTQVLTKEITGDRMMTRICRGAFVRVELPR